MLLKFTLKEHNNHISKIQTSSSFAFSLFFKLWFLTLKYIWKEMLEINTCHITIHEPITNEAFLPCVHWNKSKNWCAHTIIYNQFVSITNLYFDFYPSEWSEIWNLLYGHLEDNFKMIPPI